MSAVTSTSLTATGLGARASLRDSRAQRPSSAARPCRRAASRGVVVRAEEATTKGACVHALRTGGDAPSRAALGLR